MSAQKTTPFGIVVAVLIGIALMIGIAEIAMRILFPHWSEFYSGRFMKIEAVPGHTQILTGNPAFDGYFAQNNGDFRVRITINQEGFRDPKPLDAADGAVWIIGDSMAFGWGVEFDQTYAAVIGAEGRVSTYNVASPGTDVCGYQALNARMPKHLKPIAVIVGLILENDVHSYDCPASAREQANLPAAPASEHLTLGKMKEALTQYSALYNAVAVSLKRVRPIVEALELIGLIRKEHAYRVTFGESEIQPLVMQTAAEVDRLKAAFGPNVPFGVLITPGRFEIRDGDPFYRKLRERMVAALKARDIAVIDPFDSLNKAGFKQTHFAHDGHWSPLGHRIAGEAATAWLRQQGVAR